MREVIYVWTPADHLHQCGSEAKQPSQQADVRGMPMIKRARPHFRVAEFASGQPWIVMECFDGDKSFAVRENRRFRSASRDYEEAQRIAKFLKDNLIVVSET